MAETDGITGTWDSIHVAEIKDGEKQSHYKLTTTIILQCTTSAEGVTNEVGGYKMQVVRGLLICTGLGWAGKHIAPHCVTWSALCHLVTV